MPPSPIRCLVVESEPPEDREARRDSVGRSSGESYRDTLSFVSPGAECRIVRPVDRGEALPDGTALAEFDGVFLTGSPIQMWKETPETRRMVAFMRAVFASGTPSFGSCAGLQVATVAAGGTVRPNRDGHEAGFARRIAPSEAGRSHPLLAGRPGAYDAPAIHTDEVETLPPGATLLAGNAVSAVQAAEIRLGPGVFWGVQYHPELTLFEIAAALRRQADGLVKDGLARGTAEVCQHADMIEALDREPERRDLAWRLGVDREVTDRRRRLADLTNFIDHAVAGCRAERGRG